ncbi:MAG: enoyl-ACP reductase [Bacteriovoracaceae bacterium]|jgi:enoyl-[acyl-carrier protein] reductase I|nr:enoyl-ACP reductase [Bacteriovoracaceae bacterium]
MKLLEGKNIVIFGVANERSIAWAMAKMFKEQGANIALSYVNDAIKKRVEPLAQQVEADFIFEMDVTNDDHYDRLSETIKSKWNEVDGIVHSIAFANREDLKGNFAATSREGFKLACDVSAFSLIGISQSLKDLMKKNSSIVSMTYYGSQKVITNYNVMGVAKAALEASTRYLADDLGKSGIRVNTISAGPIKTLAASGISGFRDLLSKVEDTAPLKKNITTEDVAGTGLYLMSDLSKSVTGQTLYVDSGLSILGGF